MKLHYLPISPNSRRVLAVAYHLGYDPALVKMDPRSADFDSADFARLNPNGLAPVLEDEGFTLWESCAIMQYLADQKGDRSFLPTDPRNRADVTRWQLWSVAHLERAGRSVVFERVFKPAFGIGSPNAAVVAEGIEEYRGHASVLDGQLSGRPFITGANVTVADFSIVSSTMYAEAGGLPLREFRNIAAWRERMESLEGYRRAVALTPPLSPPK